MPSVQVNDITMYYEVHGEGEPLVVILGLASDVSEYGWLVDWLSQRYKVLVFDNRGAGRSSKPNSPYSMAMMADDTAGLMQAVGLKQANVLGISMGGRIALALALEHPSRVKNLVLVCTFAGLGHQGGMPWQFRLISFASSVPILRGKYPQPRYAFRHQHTATVNADFIDKLDNINMPTLIMHGHNDRTVPYAMAETMHAGIKQSRLLPFQGGHLFFMRQERQPFLAAVAEFLDKH